MCSTLDAIWLSGALPCLTWEPLGIKGQETLNGRHDRYLEQMAESFKTFQKPLLVFETATEHNEEPWIEAALDTARDPRMGPRRHYLVSCR